MAETDQKEIIRIVAETDFGAVELQFTQQAAAELILHLSHMLPEEDDC